MLKLQSLLKYQYSLFFRIKGIGGNCSNCQAMIETGTSFIHIPKRYEFDFQQKIPISAVSRHSSCLLCKYFLRSSLFPEVYRYVQVENLSQNLDPKSFFLSNAYCTKYQQKVYWLSAY